MRRLAGLRCPTLSVSWKSTPSFRLHTTIIGSLRNCKLSAKKEIMGGCDKVVPYMPWRHKVGGEVELHPFLTSDLDLGEWSTPQQRHFTPGKLSQYPLGVWWTPEIVWTSIAIVFRRERFLSYRGAIPGRVQPVSMSLYLPRCSGLCVQDKGF